MARSKPKLERYIFVGILTLLVFSLGIALGFIIDIKRIDWIQGETITQQYNIESLQLQQFYLTNLPKTNESCSVLKITLENSLADLGYTLDKISQYGKENGPNKEEYKSLSRKYILDNIKYWLLADQSREICNLTIITVLYFYSDEKCDICPQEGTLLTYYKKIFDDRILIFPINVDFEKNENMIKILRSRYSAYELPSIVIKDKTYYGVSTKQDLGTLLCDSFSTPQPECVYQ